MEVDLEALLEARRIIEAQPIPADLGFWMVDEKGELKRYEGRCPFCTDLLGPQEVYCSQCEEALEEEREELRRESPEFR